MLESKVCQYGIGYTRILQVSAVGGGVRMKLPYIPFRIIIICLLAFAGVHTAVLNSWKRARNYYKHSGQYSHCSGIVWAMQYFLFRTSHS